MEQFPRPGHDFPHDLAEGRRVRAREQFLERVTAAIHYLKRDVHAIFKQVNRDILPEIG